ncbi:hypothetical protein LL946_16410 [Knoellia locipacati]|uniref:hypothetical protein n=1 Tax=Knoellia locipacati TaxID=882824 RepID=UPI0038508628
MNQHTRRAPRIAAALCATSFLLAVGATSASARPDPGQRHGVSVEASTPRCTLHRVVTQYARCDDLTGNGVSAPSWVPES